jgi:hypothetical protein
MLNVSFRRVRDNAFTTRDPHSIAVLAQVLVTAVEGEVGSNTPMAQRITNLISQLEEEYDMLGIGDMVFDLLKLDPSRHTGLQFLHQENVTNHPSDFWKSLARALN